MKLKIISGFNEVVLTAGKLKEIIIFESNSALSQIFLKRIQVFLKLLKDQKIKITGVAVDQSGPSFSSLRAILTFVNLYAKQNSLPIFDLRSDQKIKLATPQYSREPNITKAKKLTN